MRILRVLTAMALLLILSAGVVYAGQSTSEKRPNPVWVET